MIRCIQPVDATARIGTPALILIEREGGGHRRSPVDINEKHYPSLSLYIYIYIYIIYRYKQLTGVTSLMLQAIDIQHGHQIRALV